MRVVVVGTSGVPLVFFSSSWCTLTQSVLFANSCRCRVSMQIAYHNRGVVVMGLLKANIPHGMLFELAYKDLAVSFARVRNVRFGRNFTAPVRPSVVYSWCSG